MNRLWDLIGGKPPPGFPERLRDVARLRSVWLPKLSPRQRIRMSILLDEAEKYGESPWEPGTQFSGSAQVYQHYKERFAALRVEHFVVMLLDNKHRLIDDLTVSVGSLTSSIVHPRDVYRAVVEHAAAAVIFVHNHPSGDPTPSREDIEITKRLRDVGELLGIRVLDHVVIGSGRFVSFVDDGYW